MIDTSELTNLDLCMVTLGADDDDEWESKEIFCIFINGVFQNLTEDHHCYEVYGSSVLKFRKLHSIHPLMKILVDKMWITIKETKLRTNPNE